MKIRGKRWAGRSLSLVILTILVVAGMAAAIVVVSNTINKPTNVIEHAVQLDWLDCQSTSYQGPERAPYGNTSMLGMTYDFKIRATSMAAVDNTDLRIDIGRSGIAAGDVTLRRWDGSAWTAMLPTLSGSILIFKVSLTNMDAEDVKEFPFQIAFNTLGSYTLDAYAFTP